MMANRSASGSWQNPTSARNSVTYRRTSARLSAVGSGRCTNRPFGSPPRICDLAAQRFEQPATEHAPGTGVGIEQDTKSSLTNPGYIDRRQDGSQVCRGRVRQHSDIADSIIRDPCDLAAAIAIDDLLPVRGANDLPSGVKQLEPVVREGIVAGGDLNAAGGPSFLTNTPVVGVAAISASSTLRPTAHKSGAHRIGQHSSGRSSVARDNHRTRRQSGRERTSEAGGHFRRQALANDTPQPGNTDDRFFHKKCSARIGKRSPNIHTRNSSCRLAFTLPLREFHFSLRFVANGARRR